MQGRPALFLRSTVALRPFLIARRAGSDARKRYTRCRWTLLMTSDNHIIVKDPKILHGAPVFRGTRVPLQALVDYLEGGNTLEEFLEGYPAVTREMAIAALAEAKELLSARA